MGVPGSKGSHSESSSEESQWHVDCVTGGMGTDRDGVYRETFSEHAGEGGHIGEGKGWVYLVLEGFFIETLTSGFIHSKPFIDRYPNKYCTVPLGLFSLSWLQHINEWLKNKLLMKFTPMVLYYKWREGTFPIDGGGGAYFVISVTWCIT